MYCFVISSTALIIGIWKLRKSLFLSSFAISFQRMTHTAGDKKCSDSSLPNRMIAALVIFPALVIFALFKKVASSQLSISLALLSCLSVYFSLAIRIASGSRSSMVASSMILAVQSPKTALGSERILCIRSCVISTRESAIRCHAFLCA